MKLKKFTNREMLKLPEGTLVKIKDHIDCRSYYKKGGRLIFQDEYKRDDDERLFGIRTEFGVCFTFSSYDYQFIDKIIPLDENEMTELSIRLQQDPKWIKAEKEDTAKRQIQWFCEDNGITFKEIQRYQFRLIKDDSKLDIFPHSKKFHDITKDRRGTYNNLLEFLCKHFNVSIR